MRQRRTLQEAKAERRRRWAARKAKRPPGDITVYGLGSMLSMLVFGVWAVAAPSVFASVALSLSIIVFAACVVFEWKWSDLNGS